VSKSTDPITYRYLFNDHVIEVTREHCGTAYPENGNVHNPTEYFVWNSTLDGESATSWRQTRAVAYEYARAKALGIPYRYDEGVARRSENVRFFTVVADEMKDNYVGRFRPEGAS
jgi:hypothetical protein